MAGTKLLRLRFVFGFFLVLIISLPIPAVDFSEIDDVRGKELLDRDDLLIIDKFVKESVEDMLGTRDFTIVSQKRQEILRRMDSAKDSAKAQYDEQFADSIRKHISEAIKQAEIIETEEVRANVILNLMILVDNLENKSLVDVAMSRLDDIDPLIRYWAVHAVTNPGLEGRLRNDPELLDKITKSLNVRASDENCDEILSLMVDFAGRQSGGDAEDMLLTISQTRTKQYERWEVNYELMDASLLKALCDKVADDSEKKADLARAFSQLFSYVMQRYINGQEALTDVQKKYLVSVMAGTEKNCLGKLFGQAQSLIKTSLEDGDIAALQKQHDSLFGTAKTAGRLGTAFEFDFGKMADGSKRLAPLELPDIPSDEN